MSLVDRLITIAIAALATMMTRFIPFFIFSKSDKTPIFVKKLGDFLPPAILGILVVYCYKDVLFTFNNTTLISIAAGIVTLVIHLWKKNMFLSIFAGTFCYMLLCNLK